MDSKVWKQLVIDVLKLRGNRCCHCRSEEDLLIYQFKCTAEEDHKPPEAFIVLCEPCKVKRREEDMKADQGDWVMPLGKYKNRRISECPVGYLDWLIGEEWLREGLKHKIEEYLEVCAGWHSM